MKVGVKSENRVQIIADMDTTKAIVTDAEKFFNDLEAREKNKKEKNEEDT